MAKKHTYKVVAGFDEELATVKAKTPAQALRDVCGDDLVEQDGRYGKLKRGCHVVALLVPAGGRYLGGHENGR